jgi:A/G-specific adenine glycosylase
MWTDGLEHWYAANGRHRLPWRLTTDPWAVLVSEVMLQQTSVSRVLPRWDRFLRSWPDPASCASAPLAAVLREWQGLGYPRRARALWLTAAQLAAHGWPRNEKALRTLPGIGAYTARALLAFSDLGTPGADAAPPRDVNLTRVAARAGLRREPGEVRGTTLDALLRDGRPAGMAMREYSYALFDVGALHCRATPRCAGCALSAGCTFGLHGERAVPRRRQPRYQGSLRQLRGAILAAALEHPTGDLASLREAVAGAPGASPERFDQAVTGLLGDGLLPGSPAGARR